MGGREKEAGEMDQRLEIYRRGVFELMVYEKEDFWTMVISFFQNVSYLRKDFSEENDNDGRNEEAYHTRGQICHKNGGHWDYCHVTEE